MDDGFDIQNLEPADLAEAIDNGELQIHYQPKVSLATGRLVGAEALSRWTHPTYGAIPPGHFIPLAERNNLIQTLTRRVIAVVARQGAAWMEQGFVINIAVNVSAVNLAQLDLPDVIEDIVVEAGFSCRNLTLELTESATQGVVELLDTLTRFRLKGAQLSLDDFGTGYSSLVQLHQLPFSEMKVDKSFVSELGKSKDSDVIVKTIIDLAHNLGLKSVAEGVETQEALSRLHEFGCNAIQGYLISKPLPADEFFEWASALKTRQGRQILPPGLVVPSASEEPGQT